MDDRRKEKVLLFGLFFLFLTLDWLSKHLIWSYVPLLTGFHPFFPYGGIAIFQWGPVTCDFNHIENSGAIWGIFSNYGGFLLYFRVFLALFLVIYLFFINQDQRRTFPLLCIFSGAVGNILDYILYGRVIDFIHFTFWGYSYPIFNIADSLITVGIFWLFFLQWKSRNPIKSS